MLNIFPPMVTNELLNTFWIISAHVALVFLLKEKKFRKILYIYVWFTVSVVLGMWTKFSIILILPASIFTLLYVIKTNPGKRIKYCILTLAFLVLASVFSYPVVQRTQQVTYIKNLKKTETFFKKDIHPPDFYYRLDWIWKADMYRTQYYSFIGAAWNSFWSDGHNAVTPFVKFHKKAFILWVLGFILTPISLYGYFIMYKKQRVYMLFMVLTGLVMLGMYGIYNSTTAHYSAARLTYEMGIVLPYAFGITAAAQKKLILKLLLVLLTIQFVVMYSFFWIEPWWHVAK
jgi:hypothetical protein